MAAHACVTILSLNVGRAVINETGFTGTFEINLEWSPDQLVTDKPSLFTAVEDQLGLKLEAVRRPTDVLVIDHVGDGRGFRGLSFARSQSCARKNGQTSVSPMLRSRAAV